MTRMSKALTAVAVLATAQATEAGPLRRILSAVVPAAPTMGGGGHAAAMASSGRIFHSGRFANGASCEGVGFSTVSAADAVRHCCYWGQRTPVSVDVRRGNGGWFAVVQYR